MLQKNKTYLKSFNFPATFLAVIFGVREATTSWKK